MKILGLFLLFMSGTVLSQEKLIDCTNNACSYNFLPTASQDKSVYSIVEVAGNTEDVIVSTQPAQAPRSVRLDIQNMMVPGRNLNINLNSTSALANAGDVLLLGDLFNLFTLKLDGFQGASGKSAAEMCANHFSLGVNGFGQNAKTEFDYRRISSLELPSNKCVDLDVKYLLDNSFQCDSGFQELDIANPTVIVNRLKGKNRCIGVSYSDVCLSRTVKVTCEYRIKYTDPPAVANTFSPNEVEYRVLTLPENEYLENRGKAGYFDYICNSLSRLDSEVASVELIKNYQFYNDLRNWENTASSWNNESLRFLGSGTQTVKPMATQLINTEPGQKYRVQVLWKKSADLSYVGSAKIAVYDSQTKVNLLSKSEIYEVGAIAGVFLTTDDLPYHYGYVPIQNNTYAARTITIKNKDDRVAINCAAPYLSGSQAEEFQILNDNCSTNTLAIGATCSLDIKPKPNTIGRKEAFLRRNCTDEYGNTASQLNEKVVVHGYEDKYQIDSNGVAINKYTDGYYWRLESGVWLRCSENLASNLNCYFNSPIISTNMCTTKGTWCPGYTPSVMAIGSDIPTPTIKNFPLILNSSIASVNQRDSKEVDFVFEATTTQSLIELSAILRFHTGNIEYVSVKKISANAGPTIKPPASKSCPNVGCVAGQLGNGYWERYGTAHEPTTPGFDPVYYTTMAGSDWSIVYVGVGQSCPQYYTGIKQNYLTSNLGFDDNDSLCDDVILKEDPTGKIVKWKFIDFERLPEFGTELVQCTLGNCSVQSGVQDLEKNALIINPASGSNGTQQGSGLAFVYDINSVGGISSLNGKGGLVGDPIISSMNSPKVCAKIRDAVTEGTETAFAKDPYVNFYRYKWQPIKVIESGNYGQNPVDNGKDIKYFKKIDSSVRYLLKKELF